MHKGALYPLEPRTRNWSWDIYYPEWPALEYDLHVETWAVNTIGAPAPMDLFNVPVDTINPAAGQFLQIKHFNVGAINCSMGLLASLNATKTSCLMYGWLNVGIVQQTDFALGQWGNPNNWQGWGNIPFGTAIGTAVLYPNATGLTWTRVGY